MKKKLSFYLISVSMFFGSLSDSGNREMPSKEDLKSLTEPVSAKSTLPKSKWLGTFMKKNPILFSAYEPLGMDQTKRSGNVTYKDKETYNKTYQNYHVKKSYPAHTRDHASIKRLRASLASQLIYSAIGKTWTSTKISVLTRFGLGTAKKRFLALGLLYQKDDPLYEFNTSQQTI